MEPATTDPKKAPDISRDHQANHTLLISPKFAEWSRAIQPKQSHHHNRWVKSQKLIKLTCSTKSIKHNPQISEELRAGLFVRRTKQEEMQWRFSLRMTHRAISPP
jgi:hypothetical protein